jgi:membrane protein DedA with SNARE-associated domain
MGALTGAICAAARVQRRPGGKEQLPDLSHVIDALRAAYDTWGYPLVLLGALLENTALLGLVLPGGSLVLLGAVYAQQGVLAWPLVLVLGWLGMVLGTSLDYAFGRWALRATLGQTRLMARLEPKLGEAERFLVRHGTWAFLLAHFIGHVRSFVALTAGTSRLPYRRFLRYEALAALAWNLVWVMAGYLVGANLGLLQRLMSGAGLAVVLVVVAGYLAYRLFARKRAARDEVKGGCT